MLIQPRSRADLKYEDTKVAHVRMRLLRSTFANGVIDTAVYAALLYRGTAAKQRGDEISCNICH